MGMCGTEQLAVKIYKITCMYNYVYEALVTVSV
jgi:hypothetical protein